MDGLKKSPALIGSGGSGDSGELEIDFENESRQEIKRILTDRKHRLLRDEHRRLEEERKARQKRRPRRTGVARVSNTDTIQSAMQVRARLLAKLKEGAGSDMDPMARDVFVADIQLQISRVDQAISAIRRRARAVQEERSVSARSDTPEARRRRFRDMQKKTFAIRRDLLYPASEGGFDPNRPSMPSMPAVPHGGAMLPPAVTLRLGDEDEAAHSEGPPAEPAVDISL